MDKKNSRYTAVYVLNRVFRDNAYSNLLLKDIKDSENIKFCTALVYGTLNYALQLDFIIEKYTSKKLDIEIRNILRTALYQIIYMKTPSNAVVNESVKLAKAFKKTSAGGFINAILRKFLREYSNEEYFKDIKEHIKYSVPKWLYDLLLEQYGKEDTVAFLENALLPPPANDGEYSQDFSSYLACEALNVKNGMTVLDMCAAPGGKTFTISKMLNCTGKIYAVDLHPHRVQLIEETAKKLGLENITALCGDSAVIDNLSLADRILCDVPCSGLGVIRRKPDIKLKPLPNLKDIQYSILENASRFLKNGGELVYSTCTLNKEENKIIVEKFLENHNDFQLVVIDFKSTEIKLSTMEKPMVTILPKYFNSDGFFIAKFRKNQKND
ncbi:MAG: methyltransferase domain-containing protein [Oscillospiraceae bacterium]|jgi:16S rRNA (cytosine967-C5)-methyltransferase|nr:methyltransferase domain-containing protein [Oscillospiraceae bacterium]